MGLKLEPIDTSDILVTAWADDDAIDWEASETKPEDYSTGKELAAKTGQDITWFYFRPLTRREDMQIRARYGATLGELSADGGKLPIAKIELMALEAARLAIVEIEGPDIKWKGKTLPDSYVDGKGAFAQALFYVGEKVIRLSKLSETEATF